MLLLSTVESSAFRQPVRERYPVQVAGKWTGKHFRTTWTANMQCAKKKKKKTIEGQEIISTTTTVIWCVDSKSWNESYGHIASSNISKKTFKKNVKLLLTETQRFLVEAISKGSHLQQLPMIQCVVRYSVDTHLQFCWVGIKTRKKKQPWKHRNSCINKIVLLPVTINKYYIWGTTVHQWSESKAAAVPLQRPGVRSTEERSAGYQIDDATLSSSQGE